MEKQDSKKNSPYSPDPGPDYISRTDWDAFLGEI